MSPTRLQLVFGLTYHGSTALPVRGLDNVFSKHISVSTLRQHLEWLKRRFEILTISEILMRSRRETLPRKTAFIAFHDGYRDNYDVAFPLLKQFGMTADFFIPTAFIGSDSRFWVDTLDAALKYSSRKEITIMAGENSEKLSLSNDSEKVKAALKLRRRLKTLALGALDTELNGIVAELGWEHPAQVPRLGNHEACLSWDQVREMSAAGMKFGSHTHRHLICAAQAESVIRDELQTSKKLIEEEIGTACTLFCYPNGSYPDSGNDFTDQVARKSGYEAALYMISPYNLINSETFRLTGMALGDHTDLGKFKAALSPLRFRWYRWQKRQIWPWESN